MPPARRALICHSFSTMSIEERRRRHARGLLKPALITCRLTVDCSALNTARTPGQPWGVNRHDLGVRSIRAQETAMSLAGQTSIDGKPTRFRTFQVCPKDLPVLLRQFACAAWAGD